MTDPALRPTPRRRRDATRGFTLVELLVVIAIIGVLAAVLIPSFNGAQKRSWDAAALQCARAIKTGAVDYRARTGGMPSAPGTSFPYTALGEDVVEACQDVQVRWHNADGLTAATTGTTQISTLGPGAYCFVVWHQRGSMWINADQCNFTAMRFTQVPW
jgi:type IV pilus assembly protein PilA